MFGKMTHTILMILMALVFTAELKVIEIIQSNANSREHSPEIDETEAKSPSQEISALKNSLRNEMFDNYAGKYFEVTDRVEEILDPVTQDNSNSSNILLTFVKNVRRQVNLEPNSSSQKFAASDGEIMQTAEMYLRPLSRYRELQEKRKNQTSQNDNNFHSKIKERNLLSKSPEFCMPANGAIAGLGSRIIEKSNSNEYMVTDIVLIQDEDVDEDI